ncbi:riboflavin synthase subunit alpha [sulfur-oxidizing endosymbiont of Gigantopelta aegis]|uniref:riboflavin synthase subunit alpha n=1 Tax=sulfur-oxidizing endosymbiont of Gigantopelta aegis TaxID=2794934 RepID=UPI0018DCB889|nr:riboflavin synthase subunit alpha [sulfur-oxidizing endosymbiont of Gigantopelta aegis]
MFTGIVQGTAIITQIIEKEDFRTHIIEFNDDMLSHLSIGASVAHNGCCLTVTRIEDSKVSFDLMQETLHVTNLGELTVGDRVNIERAARFGDEIGGHQMSGHILFMATISQIEKSTNNCQIGFEIPEQFKRFVFTKGYIGIDGISLTIGDVKENTFNVNLIPETLQRTNLSSRKIGDKINIEIDPQTQAIVETIERIMASKLT